MNDETIKAHVSTVVVIEINSQVHADSVVFLLILPHEDLRLISEPLSEYGGDSKRVGQKAW